MKLKDNFIVHDIDGTQFLVPVGAEAFKGVVRNNKTAAFIVECLREETTQEAVLDALCEKYNAPRGEIAGDLNDILNTLRIINALDE